MSRARKVKKRFMLTLRQIRILQRHYLADEESFRQDPFRLTMGEFILRNMSAVPPAEEIRQARHERRVFGHDVSGCRCCTFDDVQNAISWNQPPNVCMGRKVRLLDNDIRIERGYDGHVYRRRILNRRKKK